MAPGLKCKLWEKSLSMITDESQGVDDGKDAPSCLGRIRVAKSPVSNQVGSVSLEEIIQLSVFWIQLYNTLVYFTSRKI